MERAARIGGDDQARSDFANFPRALVDGDLEAPALKTQSRGEPLSFPWYM